MAAPLIPIEIWAYRDLVLPNTHEYNKARPIDDLWEKGWDLGEKPSCEEFNYVLNMYSQWIKYITGEQIPGLDSKFLRVNQNLADVPDKAKARTNLDVYSRAEMDTRYVNTTGDTMTGALTLPRINLQPSSSDFAYITTTNPAADWTYLDFVVGDNPGTAGTSGIDTMRFRFQPVAGTASTFTMLELNAINNTTALARITGNLVVSGSIQGTSVNATTGTFTNANVSNTLTTSTLQSTTARATNLTVTSNATVGALNATNGLSAATLYIDTNSARVAGKNIVRSVNNAGADANGNVNIALPPQGVQNVRLGTQYGKIIQQNVAVVANPGGVTVGWRFEGNNPGGDTIYFRPIQILLNNQWVTIGGV